MTTVIPLAGKLNYCNRFFSIHDINRIRQIIADDPKLNRCAISRLVCKEFEWYKLDGGLKEMSCRVALLRMHRDGYIVLPPPKNKNGNGKIRIQKTKASDPPDNKIKQPVGLMDGLCIDIVDTKSKSKLWNEYIERYHYLGYTPLPGAQIRLFIYNFDCILACLGFGAAAWSVACRDSFIGWNSEQRKQNLHLIVNNARFLILPWVESKNLASKILSMTSRMIPDIWKKRYNYKPACMETFVESNRFKGTCYKAANWKYLGKTTGRGKLDVKNKYSVPIKDIFVYPLNNNFRVELLS